MRACCIGATAVLLLMAVLPATHCCTHVGSIVNGMKNSLKKGYDAPRRAHKGCYKRREPGDYKSTVGSVNLIEQLSWEKCRDQCYGPNKAATNKEEVIGLQDQNCWCFHQFEKADQSVDSECNIECAGDKKQTCGGAEYISVYSSGAEEGMSG